MDAPKEMIMRRDFEQFIEFSYDAVETRYTARFLDGSTRSLQVNDLPAVMCSVKHHWDLAELSLDRMAIIVPRHYGALCCEIPAHVFHARGSEPDYVGKGIGVVHKRTLSLTNH